MSDLKKTFAEIKKFLASKKYKESDPEALKKHLDDAYNAIGASFMDQTSKDQAKKEIILAVQSQIHKHPALLRENQGMMIFNKTCTLSNAFTNSGDQAAGETIMKLMGQFENLRNLCEVENDLFTLLKADVNPDLVSVEDYNSVLGQDHSLHRHYRALASINNVFGRPCGPMLLSMVIIDAIIDEISSPIQFGKDMSSVELLTVVMKAARFNKVCARTFRVDNSIQGPFTSSATLNMFSELVKEIMRFNEKATNLQIQQVMANYPLEGKTFCYLRLVATDCKLMISAEQDSLHKSLRYLSSKRKDNLATRGNNRNARGSRRARPY